MNIASDIIRKHVTLIHAFSSMSNLQRKIVNALLSECTTDSAIPADVKAEGREFVVPLSCLLKKTKFNSKNTGYFKESVDSLASIKIDWNLLKDRAPKDISFLNLRVLHGAPTFKMNGTVHFSFHKFIFKLLESPDIYGTINLDLQADFDSKYSHALYESCTRFLNMNKGKIIQLDTFRKLLCVGSEKFSSMRELNRNVIKVATEEVNDRAGFIVNLDTIKAGRKVTAVHLNVVRKKDSIKTRDNISEKKIDLCDKIKKTFPSIQERILYNIVSNYDAEYIIDKIEYTIRFAKKDLSGCYPVPYFIAALKNNYKSSMKSDEIINTETIVAPVNKWKKKQEELIGDLNHWRKIVDMMECQRTQSVMLENTLKTLSKCQERLDEHEFKKVSKEKEVAQ